LFTLVTSSLETGESNTAVDILFIHHSLVSLYCISRPLTGELDKNTVDILKLFSRRTNYDNMP